MSKGKDAQVAVAIVDYLNKQNRPYSAIDIFNNLHKEHGKTAVVKVLEGLAAEGKIKEKVYGKQKVYVADQSQFPDVSDEEIKKMDLKINSIKDELKEVQSRYKQLDNELKNLVSSMTTKDAKQELSSLTKECEQLRERLKQLKENQNSVSPKEREQIMASRTKFVKEWRKRKRMANDILDAILEGYPKKKKDLFEEVGIETDEDFQVSPPEL